MTQEAKDSKAEKKKVKCSSAHKRELQSSRKRLANRAFRSQIRTAVRSLRDAVEKGEKAEAKTLLGKVASLVDKGVHKRALKRNKANRIKSRLTAFANS